VRIFIDPSSNFTVVIYTNDHDPPHVHIFKGSQKTRRPTVKINLGNKNTPPSIVKVDKMDKKDVKLAWKLVAQHQEEFLHQWYKIHGFPKLDSSN
jgi:hypothetical protein